jgi:CBS domain-containing protein
VWPSRALGALTGRMTVTSAMELQVFENGKLVGIISSGDILARELKDQEETIKFLHEYMQGPN